MLLFVWFVVGAVAGYVVGLRAFDDEGLGVAGHVSLGCIGGIAGGLAGAFLTGVPDPVDTFSLATPLFALAGAVVAVLVANLVAEGQQLGV